MSAITPSRLRFAINLGNAVLAHLEKTASRQALPPSSAIDWRSAGASSPSSSPILPPVKWWPTPAANAGISPFWPSTRRGGDPALYFSLYHHSGDRAGESRFALPERGRYGSPGNHD